MAQAGAGLHALKHFGMGGDPAGVPGPHSQPCLECASFASLDSVHGGAVTAFAVAALAAEAFPLVFEAAATHRRPLHSFRSRAPPR